MTADLTDNDDEPCADCFHVFDAHNGLECGATVYVTVSGVLSYSYLCPCAGFR